MALTLFGAVLVVSAFINNVAATAMFIPVAESLARAYRVRPSRLLMPVAYASLLGGVCTLTGSSTNVAVAGMLQKSGFPQLGVFELSPVGLPLAAVGLVYLVVFSRWLPGRAGAEGAQVNPAIRRVFLTELSVAPGSPAVGRTLRDLDLVRNHRLSPVGLIRGAARLAAGVLDTELKAGDVVVVEGNARAINRGAPSAGLSRRRSNKAPVPGYGEGPTLVEAAVSYESPPLGRQRNRPPAAQVSAGQRGGHRRDLVPAPASDARPASTSRARPPADDVVGGREARQIAPDPDDPVPARPALTTRTLGGV